MEIWATAEDEFGCASLPSDTLRPVFQAVPDDPVIALLPDNILSCDVIGDFYEWRRDSVLLTDSTQQIDAVSDGHYTVRVFNGNCASNYAPGVDVLVGIEELQSEDRFRVFPSPTEGSFSLDLNLSKGHHIVVSVTAPDRTMVIRKDIFVPPYGYSTEFDLSDQPRGMYFLVIQSEGRLFARKIILQ